MRPVVSVAEMREADAAALVPVDILVQRAGRAVANRAMVMLGGAYGRRVVVIAGKGNNGADGRSAAAFLTSRGAAVTVMAPGVTAVPPCDLVIDAAFGTGFRGEYAAPRTDGVPVLAVDIPSGVDGDTGVAGETAVRAEATVTMAALKPGLVLGEGPDRAGVVEVVDIGLPVGCPATHAVEDADLAWMPPRTRDSHKWSRAVWVLAGSPGMRGAPLLCIRGAQRAGAGMIHAGGPGVGAGEHPPGEAVYVGLPAEGWVNTITADLDRFRALVVGPGLGRDPSTVAGVRELLGSTTVPTVVDADGLYALGEPTDVIRAGGPVVLTPHDGEFRRLAGRPPGPDRIAAVRALADRTGAVVLLKGSTTVVAEPGSVRVLLALAGDARLGTAGTGDVLSGVIGAFIAAGVPAFEAAALGAHVHGRAAHLGPATGLLAGDLPDLVAAFMSGAR